MKKMLGKLFAVFEIIALIFVISMTVIFIYGIRPTVILSGSMEPELMTGCVAFVNQRVEYEEIDVGDVIQFQTETGVSCIHRTINITETGIETKGDNNDNSDGITTIAQNFQGKVIFNIPKVGKFVEAVKTPAGIGVIVVIFVAFTLLSYALDNKGEKHEWEKKNN